MWHLLCRDGLEGIREKKRRWKMSAPGMMYKMHQQLVRDSTAIICENDPDKFCKYEMIGKYWINKKRKRLWTHMGRW